MSWESGTRIFLYVYNIRTFTFAILFQMMNMQNATIKCTFFPTGDFRKYFAQDEGGSWMRSNGFTDPF